MQYEFYQKVSKLMQNGDLKLMIIEGTTDDYLIRNVEELLEFERAELEWLYRLK